nr:MAG TPA: hypothetical protein [Caudoviricetes sp.]
MNLQIVTRTEFNKLCVIPKAVEKKFMPDKERIGEIVTDFMQRKLFIMEVKLDEEEQKNAKKMETAFRNYIIDNKIAGDILIRKGRFFLRSDTVPMVDTEGYNSSVIRSSIRNR